MTESWLRDEQRDEPGAGPTKDAAIQRRVALGTASNYIGQAVSLGTLFLLTPFILHRLGPAAYGLWVLLSSVVAYGSLLDLGLWGAVIKHVAAYRAEGRAHGARALVATALRLYAGLGLVAVVLGVASAPALPRWFSVPAHQQTQAAQLVVLLSLGVGLGLPGMLPLSILRGLQRYDLVNLVEVAATLVTAAAAVGLLLAGGGVVGVVAANLGGIGLMALLGAWLVQRAAPEWGLSWRGANRRLIRALMGFSWPLAVQAVAGRLQNRTDEITIGAFLTLAAVAPYNVARRLSEAPNLLARQFTKVLLPLASELNAERDRGRLQALLTAGTRVTLALSAASGGVLIVLAAPTLELWVGAEYAGAAPLVGLLTAASLLAAVQWPAGAVLQGVARHRLLAVTALGAGLANLALSIALVRPLGLAGVALGTLIPAVVEFSIIVPFALRVVGVSLGTAARQVLLPVLAPSLAMVLALDWLAALQAPTTWLALGLLAASGLAVFAVVYVGLGASRSEREAYRGLAAGAFRLAKAQWKRLG